MSGSPGTPPRNLRMTPEQFEERQRLEVIRDRKRQRLGMAARFLAAGLAAAGERDEVWTEDELRKHAQGALKVADILVDEASR